MHALTPLVLVLAAASTLASPGRSSCGPPKIPPHGSVEGGARSSYDLGGYVQYACDRGYQIQRPNVAVCIYKDGGPAWNNPPPQCTPIDCGAPESPAKGRVTVSGGTTFGSTAQYICNKGFVLIGAEFRTCREDRQWFPAVPTCKYIFCIHLGSPDNGYVSLSGNGPGSTATYGCNLGYVRVGTATRTCQHDGEWSGSEPSCRIVHCGPPDVPRYGAVTTPNGVSFGARAQYSCNTGFELQGSEFRTCQGNGEWSPEAPICKPKPVECDELGAPHKGQVVLGGRSPGSKAIYSCRPGYQLVGNPTRKCQNNGQWSGSAPFCRIINCGFLSAPLYGNVQVRHTTVGSTATYFCNRGFVLVGYVSRICQSDGRWSGEAPICNPVNCGPLGYPPKGRVTTSGYSVGSTATYSCEVGYTLEGESERECLATGEWSGKEPVCTVIDCGALNAPTNGAVEITGTAFGDKAIYSCNSGYFLRGQNNRECQNSGEWSGEEPVCQPIFCPKLHNPSYGLVRVVNKAVGSQAMYECLGGYVLVGDEYRTCQPNGEWSGHEPSCRYVECVNLRNPANGMVTTTGNDFGSRARYRCNPGHLLVGDQTRVCEANGHWSGQDPECRFVGCDYLEGPENGNVVLTGTTVGSTATYSCYPGFILLGKFNVRTCLNSGEWSGQAPTCRRRIVQCQKLPNPRNGAVVLTGTTVRSTATYSCSKGFTLVGKSRRECLPNGEWSGRPPSCTRNCPELNDPRNGRVVFTGTTVGSTATYTCRCGFLLLGKRTRTCQPNGQWSGNEPHCTYAECSALNDPRNGQVVLTGIVVYATASYSCNKGFILVGDVSRRCGCDGHWSGSAPICKPRECGTLKYPRYGQVALTGITFGSTATYSCNTGFILVGERTRTCQASGEWSGRAATCQSVSCDRLEDPQYGQVVLTGTNVGATATYSCNTGFILLGDEVRRCQANGKWSGRVPICQLVNCRDLSNPNNGRVSITGTTVGSKATYTCNRGFSLVGKNMRKCLASGQWMGEAPICKRVDCGRLKSPENGLIRLHGTTLGSRAMYVCNRGFMLKGSAFRTCQVNGEWSGETPTCIRISCAVLHPPSHGFVRLTGRRVGDTASYSCSNGYILVGKSRRECQPTGTWSGEPPWCTRRVVAVTCGIPPVFSNGFAHVQCVTVGCHSTHWCRKGFTLSGSRKRVCQSNGRWSGNTPTCTNNYR